jgi:hypothetical protein
VAALAALALAAGGCTGSPKPAPTVTPSTPAPPGTTPSNPASALQALASAAGHATYQATYTATERHPRSTASWIVWRTPQSLRVDVQTKRTRATLIVSPHGSYSCRAAGKRKTCFRVAKPGKPVPAIFRLLAEQLFSTAVDTLRSRITDYAVTAGAVNDGGPGAPASACFAVRPLSAAPRQGVARGTYCFATTGILTSVQYPSGNVVRLVHVRMTRPPTSVFRPYASPTPIP